MQAARGSAPRSGCLVAMCLLACLMPLLPPLAANPQDALQIFQQFNGSSGPNPSLGCYMT